MAQLQFSNDIKTLRFLAGEMNQGELGQKVGVTRQTIAAIEQGKYSPSLEVAFRIAHVFDKPLEEVFQWENNISCGPRSTGGLNVRSQVAGSGIQLDHESPNA